MAKNQPMVATESVKGMKAKVKKLNGPILMHIYGKQYKIMQLSVNL